MEAVAACLKISMGLALVHLQKYWLLRSHLLWMHLCAVEHIFITFWCKSAKKWWRFNCKWQKIICFLRFRHLYHFEVHNWPTLILNREGKNQLGSIYVIGISLKWICTFLAIRFNAQLHILLCDRNAYSGHIFQFRRRQWPHPL